MRIKIIIPMVLAILAMGGAVWALSELKIVGYGQGQILDCEVVEEDNVTHYYCGEPPCKRYNIEDYECVHEGYTGKGFLGMGDYHTDYWVCEGLGRVAKRCVEHYGNMREFSELMEGEK